MKSLLPHLSPPLNPRRRRAAAAVLAALVAGCSDPAEERPPIPAGTSLLDLLGEATLEAFPETNLTPELAERMRSDFTMRSDAIQEAAWLPSRDGQVEELVRQADPELKVRGFRVTPGLPRQPGTPVTLRLEDGPAPEWRGEGPFPGLTTSWRESGGQIEVFAVSKKAPRGISVEFLADPAQELGNVEPRLAGGREDGAIGPPPGPRELRRRIEIEQVSKDCLFLPAPGSLVFDLGRLTASELWLSVAVLDHGYECRDGVVSRRTGLSDGVTFGVEVIAGGKTQRVYTRTLTQSEAGQGFLAERIPLEEFQGRDVRLRLLTDPGPQREATFDYAVLGDLLLMGPPTRKPGRPHVILIDLDTLRADRLSCYGASRPTSPNIDRWAASEATLYRDARSTAGWTLPSTASIMTGLAVHQHQVRQFPEKLTEATRPIALVLREAGYETYGITEGLYVNHSFGFDLGFDTYDCTRRNNPDWEDALVWIRDRRSERPFFLFLHTYFTHAPYPYRQDLCAGEEWTGSLVGSGVGYQDVIHPYRDKKIELSEDEREYVSAMYDEGVHALDRRLGKFLDRLTQLLQDERYLVILTSDHGDELFEHDSLDHGHSLYAELLSVPLIIRYPREPGFPEPGVVPDPVSSLDIVPTILDCVGLPLPEDRKLPGRSLRQGPGEPVPRVAQLGNVESIEFQGYKLIEGQSPSPRWDAGPEQLYQPATDPREQRNLALDPEYEWVVTHLRKLREKYKTDHPPLASGPDTAVVGGAEVEALQAVGYLQEGSGGASPRQNTGKPDPAEKAPTKEPDDEVEDTLDD